MSIERTDSQQTTCNATALINGERVQVASATCSIRPDKSMNISVDLMDPYAQLTGADKAEIAAMFAQYLADELDKAAGLGIPVVEPIGE